MKKIIVYSAVLIGMAITAQAQNVGIGTTLPKARLHVADSSVLFSGPASLPGNAGQPPVSGAGNRLMWYANKAAFRAGGTTGTLWDEASVGNYSTAFGLANRASGLYTLSSGWANSSTGIGSFTSGHSTSATGNYSVALGEQTDATAYGSLVIGRYNLTAGSGTAWVDADPLFVVGNGYTYETTPGVVAIQRRNAFEIDKLGNTKIAGNSTVGGNFRVSGLSILDSNVLIAGNANIDGVAFFRVQSLISKQFNLYETPYTLDPNVSSYFILNNLATSNSGHAYPVTLRLLPGYYVGQVVVIQEKVDPNSPPFGGAAPLYGDLIVSTNIAVNKTVVADNNGSRVLLDGGMITMIWNGTAWYEQSFAPNDSFHQ